MDDKIRPYQSVDQVTIKTQIRHTIEKQGHHLWVAQGPLHSHSYSIFRPIFVWAPQKKL